MKDYQESIDEIYERLKTNYNGLTEEEAKKRLNQNGLNKIKDNNSNVNLEYILGDYTIILLFVVALFSGFVSIIRKETFFVSLVLLIIIGIIIFLKLQIRKSSKILKEKVKTVFAIRNHIRKEIDASQIVIGDILELNSGDIVPVDGRIIEFENLEIDEYNITGENFVKKKNNIIIKDETSIEYQNNKVFAGTKIINGKCIMVVTKIGMDTELGILKTKLLEIKKRETPFEKKINQVGRIIAYIIILCILIMLIIGVYQKRNLFDIVILSLSLTLAAIPEGINIITSLVLMEKNRKVSNDIKINNLDSLESLGSIDTLFIDLKSYIDLNINFLEMERMKICPIILTGDNLSNIREKINILGINNWENSYIDGRTIDQLTDDEMLQNIEKYRIFVNVSPLTKLRILEMFQTLGHNVGFIGEGNSNDLLYKQADVSIMNKSSDEFFLENTDCTLLNNNMSAVYQTICEGRQVSKKFQQMIFYLLETSLIEVLLILFSFFIDIELFTTKQLLWLNIIVNSILAGLICIDNLKENNENIIKDTYFNSINTYKLIIQSIFKTVIFAFIFFYYARSQDVLIGSSLLFILLIGNSIMCSFACSNINYSILNNKIFSNQKLIIGIIGLIIIQIILFTTNISNQFIVSGIEFKSIGLILLICFFTFLIGEFVKPLYIKILKK